MLSRSSHEDLRVPHGDPLQQADIIFMIAMLMVMPLVTCFGVIPVLEPVLENLLQPLHLLF